MTYKYLDKINSPEELKLLDEKECVSLCSEIREFLIDNVERQGGHLASNLGITELTVALHRVFDSPRDHIIFDVGHQSYVHKILTGRREKFACLRRTGGLSGFTSIKESPHDAFGAGHSSTSISAALGFAEADKLSGSDAFSIAVIGDGAYTGGMAHEALNNCGTDLKLIIVLNENGMSISLNKGRFASYLSRVRSSKGYLGLKNNTKNILSRIPLIGKPVCAVLNFVKNKFKTLFLSPNYFEDLGLYYIGPVDGNDYKKTEQALKKAKEIGRCTVVHIKTLKGKGYDAAENSPDGFHSVSRSPISADSFHSVFANELTKMADKDERIVAVTAAMGIGTGLDEFGRKHKNRYYDVGIAEGHALTFSAGLAASGLKPYVAIYSTFLQRGYDSIIHDICLQKLPVKLIVDRASLSVGDGATHHGIFDVAFLSHIPDMTIFAPITYGSLCTALRLADTADSPIAIRYPNAAESKRVVETFYRDGNYGGFGFRSTFDTDTALDAVILTYGGIITRVLDAQDSLREANVSVGIILLERLKPYDKVADLIKELVRDRELLFVEEGIRAGGAGMLLGEELMKRGLTSPSKYRIAAIDDNFASPGAPCDLYESVGLSSESIAKKILDIPLEKRHN